MVKDGYRLLAAILVCYIHWFELNHYSLTFQSYHVAAADGILTNITLDSAVFPKKPMKISMNCCIFYGQGTHSPGARGVTLAESGQRRMLRWRGRAYEAQVGNVDFYGVLVLLEGILQHFFQSAYIGHQTNHKHDKESKCMVTFLCSWVEENKLNISIPLCTSSTAQGGGGSFKNRKPIGEVGCCESGMAERSH